MSYEELDRVGVIERVIEKRLTQREAARMLGLTSRQVRRLRRAYEQDGARALASKHRGRPSNRRLPSELRREALATGGVLFRTARALPGSGPTRRWYLIALGGHGCVSSAEALKGRLPPPTAPSVGP